MNSLQTVITELEKTIAYQNKTAEDAKLQLEDEKWRLREHVQKLEDKVETILYRSLFLAFDKDLEASTKNGNWPSKEFELKQCLQIDQSNKYTQIRTVKLGLLSLRVS